MRIPRHRLLLTAALVLLGGCDAYIGSREHQARVNLAYYAGRVGAQSDADEDDRRAIGNVIIGRLKAGEETVLPLDVTGAHRAMVFGSCDDDCSDLDLRVATEDGRLVDLDEDPDAEPMVSIPRRTMGKLRLRVRMEECASSSCTFAAKQYEYGDYPGSDGTCFAVAPDGLLMTSLHVVEDAKDIRIVFPDGRRAKATVLRRSEDNDLALLRADVPTPAWLPLGGAADIKVGMPAFTVGYPAVGKLGEEAKFAEGNLSALSGYEGEPTLLQVYMPIQHGNSGGPVVSFTGRVVGIVESGVERDENGNALQLTNFARNVRVAALLLPAELRLPAVPAAENRAQAIVRTTQAVCKVEARGG